MTVGNQFFCQVQTEVARMVFRARVGVYDSKENFKEKFGSDLNCPFCRQLYENFEHISQCNSGIFCRRSLRGITLYELATMKNTQKPKRLMNF